jgi:hypothetical protein
MLWLALGLLQRSMHDLTCVFALHLLLLLLLLLLLPGLLRA